MKREYSMQMPPTLLMTDTDHRIPARRCIFSFGAMLVSCASVASVVCGGDASLDDKSADTFFAKQVLPILRQHCYECHSHEAGEASGGLVLDSRSGWSKGGESGPAVLPRKPDESLLITAVRYGDEHLKMPPNGKLPGALIARLRRWVADGAHDPRIPNAVQNSREIDWDAGRRHWAFQPLLKASPRAIKDASWPASQVDRYVLAELDANGLHPVADADAYTWLRRVSFDLTGLPPTAAEIAAFAGDPSAAARERVVDRLLNSRAFGERWARHWLDLVGYADQIGTSNSVFAQYAWRYRDYVIDAYNTDKPFDGFIREQVAGDLLPHDSVQQRASNLVATGFLVLGDIAIVEADKARLIVDIVDQQIGKTGRAFLGMTIDCARCHDHKFDPISQRDYYALGGFFHATSTIYKTERGVWSDVNVLELPETDLQKQARAQREKAHTKRIAELQRDRQRALARKTELEGQLDNEDLSEDKRDELAEERDRQSQLGEKLNQEIEHAQFFAPSEPKAHGVRDVPDPSDMRLTIRGNPRALGDRVPRGCLSVIEGASRPIPQGESGRRELADWITTSAHPLAARVAVNRVWQKLFGEGLVRSVDYFGLPGDRPSHPELLDYLAAQFVSDGWSHKRLIRLLVLSRTYRLDSAHDERANALDPENRLLWRMNRVRLDAEALRDAMIFVSGQLRPSSGGPALPLEFPENVGGLDPKDVNPPHFRFTKWRPEQELERTVYLPVIRHAAQPGPATLRNVFDFPQPSQFNGRRAITAVPTQALFLMNSPEVKKQARAVAARIKNESLDDLQRRLELLWLTVLNRPITAAERRETNQFLSEAGKHGWAELCHALLASNEFLMRI